MPSARGACGKRSPSLAGPPEAELGLTGRDLNGENVRMPFVLDQQSPTTNRTPAQFSLRSLFAVTTVIAVGLGLVKPLAFLGVAATVVGLVRCLATLGILILFFTLGEIIYSYLVALAFGQRSDVRHTTSPISEADQAVPGPCPPPTAAGC
jgi:hypothetical protein